MMETVGCQSGIFFHILAENLSPAFNEKPDHWNGNILFTYMSGSLNAGSSFPVVMLFTQGHPLFILSLFYSLLICIGVVMKCLQRAINLGDRTVSLRQTPRAS